MLSFTHPQIRQVANTSITPLIPPYTAVHTSATMCCTFNHTKLLSFYNQRKSHQRILQRIPVPLPVDVRQRSSTLMLVAEQFDSA